MTYLYCWNPVTCLINIKVYKIMIQAAKICWKRALGMGVAYDRRRKNRSVENMQVNIDRLKEYKSRLVVYPGKKGRAKRLVSNFIVVFIYII